MSTHDELTQLRAEVAELRAFRAAIEKPEKINAKALHSWREGPEWRWKWTARWIGSEYPNVRCAIDAAMGAEK